MTAHNEPNWQARGFAVPGKPRFLGLSYSQATVLDLAREPANPEASLTRSFWGADSTRCFPTMAPFKLKLILAVESSWPGLELLSSRVHSRQKLYYGSTMWQTSHACWVLDMLLQPHPLNGRSKPRDWSSEIRNAPTEVSTHVGGNDRRKLNK